MVAMRVAPGAGVVTAETVDAPSPGSHDVVISVMASGVCGADVVHCAERQIPGTSYPGGWAEQICVPEDAVARIPDGMDLFEAAPLGCAGVTTFNAIRHAGLPAGARVAVFGIGGLGHLALQFAAKLGFEVVAIARGRDKEATALELGADHYIDSSAIDPGESLRALGGADLILYTASATKPASALVRGLNTHGRLVLIGVDGGSVEIPAATLVMKSIVVTGHLTGGTQDIEDTMRFAKQHGIRPLVEVMPLEQAADAVDRIEGGQARFRIVLDVRDDR